MLHQQYFKANLISMFTNFILLLGMGIDRPIKFSMWDIAHSMQFLNSVPADNLMK